MWDSRAVPPPPVAGALEGTALATAVVLEPLTTAVVPVVPATVVVVAPEVLPPLMAAVPTAAGAAAGVQAVVTGPIDVPLSVIVTPNWKAGKPKLIVDPLEPVTERGMFTVGNV